MLKAPSPALMNEIRRNIGLLQNEEDRLLELRNAQNQQVAAQTTTVIRVAVFLGLVGVFAFALIISGVRKRRRVREEFRFLDCRHVVLYSRLLRHLWQKPGGKRLGHSKEELLAAVHGSATSVRRPANKERSRAYRRTNTIASDNRYHQNGDFAVRWTSHPFVRNNHLFRSGETLPTGEVECTHAPCETALWSARRWIFFSRAKQPRTHKVISAARPFRSVRAHN